MEADTEPLRLAPCLDRLEAILRQMDRDDIDIEAAIELYGEGVRLSQRARAILDDARHLVARIEPGDVPPPIGVPGHTE